MRNFGLALVSFFVICPALAPVAGSGESSPPNTRSAFGLDHGITPRLRENLRHTQFSWDQFGPFPQPIGKKIEIKAGERVMVSGWAVDAPAASLAGGVELVIDDNTYKLPYFLTRPDVAAALKVPAYTDSGFLGIVSPDLLPRGTDLVSLRIVSADRKSYFTTPTLRVVVRSNPSWMPDKE